MLTETKNGKLVNKMLYDNYGNILCKNDVDYIYGDVVWRDLLTAVGDKTITYDAQGNPTNYLGKQLIWKKGRQLAWFEGCSFNYNIQGIRTLKRANGIDHHYTLDGTKILKETFENNTIIPLYDSEENVCGIIYNGTPFYFQKNLQGDIIAITDENGDTLARYSYDAWGVPTIVEDNSACGIAEINPFRYRGYYYDSEIGFYYLQSRYYDPVVGRFLNSDEAEIIVFNKITHFIPTLSLFAYCCNQTIQQVDPYGFVGFMNEHTPKGDSKYDIKTTIIFRKKSLAYKYMIKKGVIKFEFSKNNYWSVLWRGAAKTLAEAMYKVAKFINKKYLKGRTISGLHTELFMHWAAYKLGIFKKNAEQADMGGMWGEGYDSNAWIFETANIIYKVSQININNLRWQVSLIRDLARYL